jgi:hypothetical protein
MRRAFSIKMFKITIFIYCIIHSKNYNFIIHT